MSTSIGQQLKSSFMRLVYLIGGLAAVIGISLLFQQSAQNKTAKLFELQRQTADVGSRMMQNRDHLSNYLLTSNADENKKLNSGISDFRTALDKSIKDAEDADEKNLHDALTRLQDGETAWEKDFVAPIVEKQQQVLAGNATVAEVQITYLSLQSKFDEKKVQQPLDDSLKAIQASVDKQAKVSSIVSVLIWVALVVFTGLAVAYGIRIAQQRTKEITEPLGHLTALAREITNSGDLDQTVDIQRTDEIGELAQTFNNLVVYLKEMASVSETIAGGDLTVDVQPRSKRDTLGQAFQEMIFGLRSMVKTVRDGASQVSSGSNQVASASEESARINVQAAAAIDEVTSTMHEMSINVQNMVKNTQTQASSVSETSASIDQMVASIQRVADTAKVLLDISQRSRDEVHSGIVTMEKATDGLNRINNAIDTSAGIIKDLGQKTEDIGKIVEVIDDLAEQTNLLALNAAIEAARAGEHGLGFAVVADEVRKLAEKSAQSTREISELIDGIQKEARRAVENMSKSTNIVDEGLGHGEDLGTALKKISNVVTEVYKFAQEIGAATNEQSHGSTQIAKATSRLNEITHEINSAVEEQSSGAQAVVRAMEKMRELTQRSTSGATELAASSEQMSKMARTLLESMDRFILETNGTGSHRQIHEGRGVARLAAHSAN